MGVDEGRGKKDGTEGHVYGGEREQVSEAGWQRPRTEKEGYAKRRREIEGYGHNSGGKGGPGDGKEKEGRLQRISSPQGKIGKHQERGGDQGDGQGQGG